MVVSQGKDSNLLQTDNESVNNTISLSLQSLGKGGWGIFEMSVKIGPRGAQGVHSSEAERLTFNENVGGSTPPVLKWQEEHILLVLD